MIPHSVNAERGTSCPKSDRGLLSVGPLLLPPHQQVAPSLTSRRPPGRVGRRGESSPGTEHLPRRCCCDSDWKRNEAQDGGAPQGSPAQPPCLLSSSCHLWEESPQCPDADSEVQREARGALSLAGQTPGPESSGVGADTGSLWSETGLMRPGRQLQPQGLRETQSPAQLPSDLLCLATTL